MECLLADPGLIAAETDRQGGRAAQLLPQRTTTHPGLQIATRCQPADDAFVIGDVMGSGIGAAAAMGQLRTATRTLTQLDLTPCDVLRHLDLLTANLDGSSFATCAYMICEPPTGRCQIASAGQLPPVLTRPDGTAVAIELDPGPPLGLGDT